MATTLQLRRYNTATVAGLTGADGEVFVDTTKKTLVVQDGSTAGGFPVATETFVTSAVAGLQATVSASLLSYTTNANLTSTLTNFTIDKLSSSGFTLTLSSNGALVPGSVNMDLGTSSAPFRSLYITNQTFYFGGSAVSIDSSNTFTIVTGSSTSTLVNTVALNTATSAVQSNITVLLYTQVSSVESSLTYYVNNQTSSITSSLTQQINQVSSDLIVYVDTSLSSALTSLGTVSDLSLGSDALIFTGDSTTSLELGTLFTSASIGAGASSILIRNPSFIMGSSVLNLTSGSTLFADVSSTGTNVQLPFDLTAQATWVSSWGQIIYSEFQYYGSFGGGSSYLIQGYGSSTVNTSATHTIRLFRNAYEGQVTLYEGSDFTIAGSSITIVPTWTFVYQWQLFETTGTTTSVLVIPVAPNTDTQNTWSGDPVYFNNLDVGYTTSSSQFNGSTPGKLVYTNPNGVQYYEDGTIIYPNGDVQSPNNFNIYTSSGSTSFEFTTSGVIVLPPGGDIVNSSGNSVLGGSTFDSSVLTSYTTNANLTSTLLNYTTNANLTSTLTSYQQTTSLLTLTTLTANSITVTNTSDATTTTSGGFTVAGGVGIQKALYLGGSLNVLHTTVNQLGSHYFASGTVYTPSASFQLIAGGSQTSRNNILMQNNGGLYIWGGAPSTNAPSPATVRGIRLDGGSGIVSVINSSETTSIGTGSFIVAGGVGITKGLNVGNVAAFSSGVSITYEPASTVGAAISLSAKNTQGGSGYADFLKVTNTTSGATNSSKTFRLSSAGAVEVINNAYSATLMSLSDTGSMSTALPYQVAGKQAVNGPAFSAYANNTLQSITSGSLQKVLFQVEEFDTNSNYASSTFTPTVEGYYQINAEVRFDGASGTGEMMIVLYKNGSAYKRGTNQSGTQIASNFWAMQVSSVVYANGTTDYFEIYVQQGSGGSLSVTAVNDPAITWFNGCMLRGA